MVLDVVEQQVDPVPEPDEAADIRPREHVQRGGERLGHDLEAFAAQRAGAAGDVSIARPQPATSVDVRVRMLAVCGPGRVSVR